MHLRHLLVVLGVDAKRFEDVVDLALVEFVVSVLGPLLATKEVPFAERTNQTLFVVAGWRDTRWQPVTRYPLERGKEENYRGGGVLREAKAGK